VATDEEWIPFARFLTRPTGCANEFVLFRE
jgi:hypothetical protein